MGENKITSMSLLLNMKRLPISTGGRVEAHLNHDDAAAIGGHAGDSVDIRFGDQEVTARLEVSSFVKPGYIGVVKDLDKYLKKAKGKVHVLLADKPESLAPIKKKLNGKSLTAHELDLIVQDIVDFSLTDVEVCYFVSACYGNRLSIRETVDLTKSMVEHGNTLKLRKKIVVDKHCIGGVPGNRTTMLVVTILAALGYTIPKTSSRSITSPAGTADTMEVIANVELDMKKMAQVVKKTGGCIVWGGGISLAAADDRMIHVRHSLHLDPPGLLLSSILAKKHAVGSNRVLIDIPYGPHTKVPTQWEARKLAAKFVAIGKGLGMKLRCSLSPTSQPIGYGVGPALEMRDILRVLSNDPLASQGYRAHGLDLAACLLQNTRGGSRKKALQDCEKILTSGKALEKFSEIARAQGLKYTATKKNFLSATTKHVEKVIGKYTHDVLAESDGVLSSWDIKRVASVAFSSGCPNDHGAGVEVYAKIGDRVRKGDVIMRIYSTSKDRVKFALKDLENHVPFVIS